MTCPNFFFSSWKLKQIKTVKLKSLLEMIYMYKNISETMVQRIQLHTLIWKTNM